MIMKEKHEAIARRTAQVLEGRDKGGFIGLKCKVEKLTDDLLASLFPGHLSEEGQSATGEQWFCNLFKQAAIVFSFVQRNDAEDLSAQLLESLPSISEMLEKDIEAAYRGDPAAKSLDEIILTYPAFMAIGTYRLAHAILATGVPLIPRIMSEYAHRMTGIDIHPGAAIGPWFFIDHGTGVVIGETTTIGDHVKLYQHVTIGAKSFASNSDGSLVKGIKRHPDIGSNVIIYAGATLLGGDTKIGDRAVIGGNVWLTHSVAEGEIVLAEPPVLHHRTSTPIHED